ASRASTLAPGAPDGRWSSTSPPRPGMPRRSSARRRGRRRSRWTSSPRPCWRGAACAASIPGEPGYGAAGATPVGIAAIAGVDHSPDHSPASLTIERGAPLLARATGLEAVLGGDVPVDLILTGEGSIDAQSHEGKVLGWIVARATTPPSPGARPIPVHLIGGRVEWDAVVVKRSAGATALPGPMARTLDQ